MSLRILFVIYFSTSFIYSCLDIHDGCIICLFDGLSTSTQSCIMWIELLSY